MHLDHVINIASTSVLLIDLSSVLSKNGETRNEVDQMLSVLGTSQSGSISISEDTHSETVTALVPCSTGQQARPLFPDSTSDELCQQTSGSSEAACGSYGTHVTLDAGSGHVTETQLSSVSELSGNDSIVSCMKSDRAFAYVSGSHSVLESSDVGRSNQNGSNELPVSSLSSHVDLDRSIVVTSALSTSTPLEMDDSTVTRTVPSSSACIVNMECQFAAEHPTALRHGELCRFIHSISQSSIYIAQRHRVSNTL